MTDTASLKRRLAAILAADIVGYTRLMELDEAGTLSRLKDRRQNALTPLLGRYSGRLVKLMGDGILVEFASAVNAVQCAVELQERMEKANIGEPSDKAIRLRIGINVGDVIVEGSDLYGDGVNIAARLEALAEPGSILASPSVIDQIRSKVAIEIIDLGPQSLKNVSEPLRVYRIGGTKTATDTASTSSSNIDPTVTKDARKPSVAILPLVNLSGNPEESYFVDGITEEIILELGRFRELLVIGRNSSFSLREQNLDTRTIAEKLNAQYLVTGSLKRAGNRIRISVQLTEAMSGNNIWGERYDRELTDIFELQEELAHALATAISGRVKLSTAHHAQRRGTANMNAYEWFLRARTQLAYSNNEDRIEEATKAIELDPNFAAAQALMGHLLAYLAISTGDYSCADRGLGYAKVAIALDPQDAWTHHSMGMVRYAQGKLQEAIKHWDKALDLNPNDTVCRMMRAICLVYRNQTDRALSEMRMVFLRDPFPMDWYWDVYAAALTAAGRYEEALAAFEHLIHQAFWSPCYKAICHYYLNRPDAAREAVQEAVKILPTANLSLFVRSEPHESAEILERMTTALLASGLPAS